MGELASALAAQADEAPIVAELKAGSEEAYAWLIEHYHRQIYSLVYHMVADPADAADTTQEVFIKVFRGMQRFNGASSLKTWMYRIAVHEASNRRRWWFRHKAREISLEPAEVETGESGGAGLRDLLVNEQASPFDNLRRQELRARVEEELRSLPEPYRSAVILRDLEELSYEEIAEVTETPLGTVKSRLRRGREALKKRLEPLLEADFARRAPAATGREVEVTS